MQRFYDRIPQMECLSGDTLDTFTVHVKGYDDLSGCTMQILLEEWTLPGTMVLKKMCVPIEGGFQVQLTSEDTSGLRGTYHMHFRMKDANGLSYRKLAGILHIRQVAQED